MAKQCVNCPGAVDHTTAECPLRATAPVGVPDGWADAGERRPITWEDPDGEIELQVYDGATVSTAVFYKRGERAGWKRVGVQGSIQAWRYLAAAPTVKAEQVPTPEFVWVRLLEALAGDNGCPFTASTDDYREAKPALVQLIAAGFFRDGADSLDGDIWMVAAGEQGEVAARFASYAYAYSVLSVVLNRVFDRPEEAPSLPAAGSADQPYPDGIAEDLERSDWTPLEALQWYAAGKHFDVADGRTRIIDTGAVASNALKHASLAYLELKGDAELSELRAALSAQQTAPDRVSVDNGELSDALGRVSAGLETELAAINQLRAILDSQAEQGTKS